MTRHVDDQEIRRYLLGSLPEQDEIALETAYFGDATLLDRVEAIANDLTDEYAAGRMSPADRAQFERRLLSSAEGREDAAFAQALQIAKTREREGGETKHAEAFPAWLGWAAAVVMITAGAYLSWQTWFAASRTTREAPAIATTPPTPTPPPPSEPSSQQPAAPGVPEPPAIRVATLILTADLTRSEGPPPTLIAAPDITHVDLVLPPFDAPRDTARGRIESVEGQAIWMGPIEGAAADAAARARIPVASLPPGDYIFSIVTAGPTDGPTYYFRVRAR